MLRVVTILLVEVQIFLGYWIYVLLDLVDAQGPCALSILGLKTPDTGYVSLYLVCCYSSSKNEKGTGIIMTDTYPKKSNFST